MKTSKENLAAEERFYLLLNYAQLVATITMVAGCFIVLIILLVSSGLL